MQEEVILKIKEIEREQSRRYDNNLILRYNVGRKKHKKQIATTTHE